MFPPNFAKWAFIACLYDKVASEQFKHGRLLTKEEFVKSAIVIATTPEGVGELAQGPHPVTFVQVNVPGPPAGKPLAGIFERN
jgi:hypothetical protein